MCVSTPPQRAGAVWVSNHTSMIDYIILTAYSPFAVIMQLHTGWVRAASLGTASSLPAVPCHVRQHMLPEPGVAVALDACI